MPHLPLRGSPLRGRAVSNCDDISAALLPLQTQLPIALPISHRSKYQATHVHGPFTITSPKGDRSPSQSTPVHVLSLSRPYPITPSHNPIRIAHPHSHTESQPSAT